MGHFTPDFDLRTLRGAEYNPRRIDEEDLSELRASLQALGFVKPVIARGSTIVAGHQRTRAALAVGIAHGPVYSLAADANTYDEIKFNQLHNGTDLDTGAEPVRVTRDLTGVSGWCEVSPKEVKGNFRSHGAVVRVEIQRLVARFGSWGACVVDPDGLVIHCSHYALALAAMRKPVTCYVLQPSQVALAHKYLSRSYGVFDYSHLDKHTYIQTYAQPFRLRGEHAKRSRTYDDWALPWLRANPGARLLDFGCGQGDHAREAAREGLNVLGVELFRRVRGKDALDVGASRATVQALAQSLREHGPFDGVLADHVLNSVDCPQAERAVLACLDLFCKPGGLVMLSGRPMELVTQKLRDTRSNIHERKVQFLDQHGFSALYRKGEWFYQRFHSHAELIEICSRHGWQIEEHLNDHAWGVRARKREQVLTREDYEEAIRYEFSLPVNAAGRTLDVLEIMLEAAAQVW